MKISYILNCIRNLSIFFLCLSPLSGCASFGEILWGESSARDYESIFDAIEKVRIGNVERLISKGISLEERNDKGLTPLLYTIGCLGWGSDKEKLEKISFLLIERGALLEAADAQGNTALLKCCATLPAKSSYGLAVVKNLLEHGADLEARNQEGSTPLIVAAAKGHADVLKVLLERQAYKEAYNNAHETALILAADENQIKSVSELLAAGAFVDSKDKRGMTPLMCAAYKGHIAIMQILLQYNADLTATLTSDVLIVEKKNTSDYLIPLPGFSDPYKTRILIPAGSTALNFAEKCGGRGVEKILLEAWAKKDPMMERVLIEWRRKLTEL
jgi:ankyrin repeat protein